MSGDAFLIPLKAFKVAKGRLRQGGASEVSELAQELAEHVIQHCLPRTVFVLGESQDIETFALSQGVGYWHSPTSGLNSAVTSAYRALGHDYEQLIIVHGDLHAPEGLRDFEPDQGVTIVTDHHQRGTNVLALPTGLDFHFSYGTDSKECHQREAQRLGVPWRVITNSPWALDIDEPADLELSQKSVQGGTEAPLNTRPRTD